MRGAGVRRFLRAVLEGWAAWEYECVMRRRGVRGLRAAWAIFRASWRWR